MALIEEDLRLHPLSTRSEIQKRLPDMDEKDLQKHLYRMVEKGILIPEGGKAHRKYRLA